MPKKGYKQTEKHKEKISESLMGNIFRKGKHCSEDMKERISKGLTGRKDSDETKKRKIKLGKENSFYGKHHSEESKMKMSKIAENRSCFVSSWEDKFILKCLSKFVPGRFIKHQFRLKGIAHSFDIALPMFKILIEIDGKYFHSKREHIERDAEINEFIYRTYPDWTLFRYTDEDLKKLNII